MKTSFLVFMSALCLMGCSDNGGKSSAKKEDVPVLKGLNGQDLWRLSGTESSELRFLLGVIFVCRAEQAGKKTVTYITGRAVGDEAPRYFPASNLNISEGGAAYPKVVTMFEAASVVDGVEYEGVKVLAASVGEMTTYSRDNHLTGEKYHRATTADLQLIIRNNGDNVLKAPAKADLAPNTVLECKF